MVDSKPRKKEGLPAGSDPLLFIVECMPMLIKDQEKLISYVKFMLPLDTSSENRSKCLQSLLAYANLSSDDNLRAIGQPSQSPWMKPGKYKEYMAFISNVLPESSQQCKTSKKGSKPNDDCTKIQWTREFIDILRVLLVEGADPSWTSANQIDKSALYMFLQTAKEILIKHPYLSEELNVILEMLATDKSVDTGLIDEGRRTVLHVLVDCDWSNLIEHLQSEFAMNYRGIIRRIVEKNPALLEAQDGKGRTPIHTFLRAVLKKNKLNPKILEFLVETCFILKSKSNTNYQDVKGYSILHEIMSKAHSVNKNNINGFMNLTCELRSKLNIETTTNTGETVLHLLARKVNRLLDVGTCSLTDIFSSILTEENVNKTDSYSLSPYSWILYWKHSIEDGNSKRTGEEIQALFKVETLFQDNNGRTDEAERSLKHVSIKQLLENVNTKEDLEKSGKHILHVLSSQESMIILQGSDVLCGLIEKAHILIDSDKYLPLIKALVTAVENPCNVKRNNLTLFKLTKQIEALQSSPKRLSGLIQTLLCLETHLSARNECMRALLLHSSRNPDLCFGREFKETLRCFLSQGVDPNWVSENEREKSALSIFIQTLRNIIFKHCHLFHHCKEILEIFMSKEFKPVYVKGKTPLHILMEGSWLGLDPLLQSESLAFFKEVVQMITERHPEFINSEDHEEKKCPLQILIHNILKDNKVLTLEVIKYISEMVCLLQSKDNVYMVDMRGATIVHAFLNAIPQADGKESLGRLMDIIVSLRTDKNIEIQMKNGETPLHIFARNICSISNPDLLAVMKDQILKFATKTNVNMIDSNLATPLSWILIWKKSSNLESLRRNAACPKFDEILNDLQPDKTTAEAGQRSIRGREMAKLLRKTEWKKKELDETCQKLCEIKEHTFPQCLNSPIVIRDIVKFTLLFLRVHNPDIKESAQEILRCLIGGENPIELFNTYMRMMLQKFAWKSRIVFSSWLWLLMVCADAGATPTKEHIEKVATTFNRCRLADERIMVLDTLSTLLESYRKAGNTDMVDCDFKVLKKLYFVEESIRKKVSAVIRLAFITLESCISNGNAVNVLLYIASGDFEYDNEELIRRYFNEVSKTTNGNWLRRDLLHFVAMFCDDERIFRCLPEDLIDATKRDLHGCTPLHVAYQHRNHEVAKFLESNITFETNVLDKFGICPKSLGMYPQVTNNNGVLQNEHFESNHDNQVDHADVLHQNDCTQITNAKTGVFEKLKRMIQMNEKIGNYLENQLISLFDSLTKLTCYGEYFVKTVVAGSMGEKLKIGRFDEVDIHIQFRSPVYDVDSKDGTHRNVRYEAANFGKRLHESFLSALDKVDWDGRLLRLVNINQPWQFLCGPPLEAMTVSVDVIPILVYENNAREKVFQRQGSILQRPHMHKKIEMLKWTKRYDEGQTFLESYIDFEFDITSRLSTDCRLGFLIVKALLEAYYWSNGMMRHSDVPINSYMLKTALFWLLSSEPPSDTEGSEVKLRSHRRTETKFDSNPKWITDEELQQYAEEGRKWACDILNAILLVARDYERKLPNYFAAGSVLQSCEIGQADHIVKICTTLLQSLEPKVFYLSADIGHLFQSA